MRDYDFSDDEIPMTEEETQSRLQAPCLLSASNVPCIIFGEDALCLVFRVPTMVFSLHILVADNTVDRAVRIITDSLPYTLNTNKLIPNYNNPLRVDPEQTRAYPRSSFLGHVGVNHTTHPSQIIIHPDTDFSLRVDVGDNKHSTPVTMFLPGVSFPANVRLPTQAVLVNAVIDTFLDPKPDLLTEPAKRELYIWLAYIVGYGIRVEKKVLENGELDPRARALVDAAREENRPFLEAIIRGEQGNRDISEHCRIRRDIMRCHGNRQCTETPMEPEGKLDSVDDREV